MLYRFSMQREVHASSLLILLNAAPIYWCGILDDLRATMKTIKDAYPFAILALVELQKHLHAIWSFPKIGQIIYVNPLATASIAHIVM